MPTCLAVLAAVIAAAPIVALPAEPASQPLEELDEVVVTGERLGDQIIALENSFYQLYNELNKDEQFDMYCTLIPERQGSTELTRACLPQFYADAYDDSVTWHYRCQQMNSAGFQGPACYTPPDPTFVLFARNQELQKHMMVVINSDPRLKEMNRARTALEIRLRVAQASYEQMKREEVDENGETRAQRLERLRCSRPTPAKMNRNTCTSKDRQAPATR